MRGGALQQLPSSPAAPKMEPWFRLGRAASCVLLTVTTYAQEVVLANDAIRLAVRPDLGGKVVSLRDAAGVEWLSRSGRPYADRVPGMAYGEAEFDGIDEVFPNLAIGAMDLADGTQVALADHGEVWTQAWDPIDEGPGVIALVVTGKALPYRLERRIRLDGNAAVFAYSLRHTGGPAFPYTHCFHPLFVLEGGLRVDLPDDQGCRYLYGKGVDLAKGDLPWSAARAALGDLDPASGRFWKVVALGVSTPVALVRADGSRCVMAWDTAALPHAAFWCSESGVAGLRHLACEPATSPHDRIGDALADGSVRHLAPGEVHTWTITVRLEAAHGPAP